MEFEWDERKAATNLKKHDVSFHEPGTVFGDPMATTFHDPEHSDDEHRFLTFGLSRSNRLLVVAHTDRSSKVRIIGARVMTSKKRLPASNGLEGHDGFYNRQQKGKSP